MTKGLNNNFPAILQVSHDAIIITDEEQKILFFNQSAERIFGYSAKEITGKQLEILIPQHLVKIHDAHFKKFSKGQKTSARMNEHREVSAQRKDGTVFSAEASISKFEENGTTFFSVNLNDISKRKQAEDHLNIVMERFKLATESANVGVWDLNLLTNQTIWDDRQYEIYGLKREKTGTLSYETWADRVHPEDLANVEVDFNHEFANEARQFEFRIIRPDGVLRYIQAAETVVRNSNGEPIRLVGVNIDVTEQKEAELERALLVKILGERVKELTILQNAARLLQAERPLDQSFLNELVNIIPQGWQHSDVCEARITYNGIEATTQGWQESQWKQSIAFETSEAVGKIEVIYLVEKPALDEGPFAKEERALLLSLAEMLEAHLEHLAAAESLRQREAEFSAIFENAGIGIALVDAKGLLITCNPQLEEFLGYNKAELTQMTFAEFTHPDDIEADLSLYQSLLTGERESYVIEKRYICKDTRIKWGRLIVSLVRDANGVPRFGVGMVEDVTARKEAEEKNIQLYEQANRRLKNVQALRLIDTAITSSAEIGFILDIAIEQVIMQLEMDAATILMLDPSTSKLKYTAGYGFYGNGIKYSNLHLGEGIAGYSAQQRKQVIIPDLTDKEISFSRASLLEGEKFIFYASAPIVIKGKVQGILEVFKRNHYTASTEWQDFFAALAGQISIAIDNTSLFANLQRSNADLIAAYDETLEGWSRAMDFRDKETEGHTQRVTEIALKLAQALGVSQDELVHIRRGGLLHDIGKVGVPDNILLKAGTLTPDEWAIMREHPEIAYKMLSPIQFLRQALEIPYCHHEKWDGTGYPRGLKGEQIPLSARIFAMADVWDALRSDRPYRQSWPVQKVIDHFQSLSGSHFDPNILPVFLDLIQSEDWGLI